ncbi:MAG: lipoyl(octanoyl) transferase [Deltaproteobacteria bacterium GWA2_45_12]|nr:MAG: lipoyl(octanoyl) transferase [Deltaproteobacteria bacterium GWA2_45_12]
MSSFQSQFLGRISYAEALGLMQEFKAKRQNNEIGDQILFLEHQAVVTMGRKPSEKDLYLKKEELLKKNIDFVKTDRGGKLTYHGPGQLVIYFVFDIQKRGYSIEEWVWNVEEGVRKFLSEKGVECERDEDNPGLWVRAAHEPPLQKICSVGFHVSKGVTTHGVALNLDCDLTPFGYFLPCGVEGRGITSVLKETGKKLFLEEAAKEIEGIYRGLFT